MQKQRGSRLRVLFCPTLDARKWWTLNALLRRLYLHKAPQYPMQETGWAPGHVQTDFGKQIMPCPHRITNPGQCSYIAKRYNHYAVPNTYPHCTSQQCTYNAEGDYSYFNSKVTDAILCRPSVLLLIVTSYSQGISLLQVVWKS